MDVRALSADHLVGFDRPTRQLLDDLPTRELLTVVELPSEGRSTHLAWWPDGPRHVNTFALASSRLGRCLDERVDVFRAVRQACWQYGRHTLLTTERTTLHRFAKRLGRLFGIAVLDIKLPTSSTTLASWLAALPSKQSSAGFHACYVSPAIDGLPRATPLRDRFLIDVSDQLAVLHVRRRGTLERLVDQRVERRQPTWLATDGVQLIPESLSNTWHAKGASRWRCPDFPTSQSAKTTPGNRIREVKSSELPVHKYLTHCTRRPKGAWPDQSEDDYLDELILSKPSRSRSSFAALRHILRSGKLFGSARSIRGSQRVVSFTAHGPSAIPTLRRFRRHHAHWDFEPYGIAVDRERLWQLGARPVLYGDESLWDSLRDSHRPLFQPWMTKNQQTDWTVEQEWRVLGDVDLSRVGSEEAVILVPTTSEAHALSAFTKWPFVVLNE